MICIRRIATGEIEFVDSLAGIDPAVWEATGEAAPADLATRAYRSVEGALVPVPRRATAQQAMALHTPTEIERILTSEEPAVGRLLAALQLLGVVIGSVQHVQGVTLFRALALLDGPLPADMDARAARITAGLAPE